MLSAAKVKAGCTKSRYTPELFLLKNANRFISYNETACARLPVEAGHEVIEAQ